jgi:hypothetical protein
MEVGSIGWRMKYARNVVKTARQLKAEGVSVAGMNKEEVADLIVARMVLDNPTEYGEGFDWNKLLEIIMQFLPFILMLLG